MIQEFKERLLTIAIITLLPVLLLTGCLKGGDNQPYERIEVNYHFETGDEQWVAGYADYPAGLTLADSLELYEMSYGRTTLPESIKPAQSGFRIRGHNRSDDLFMYIKRKVSGLAPSTVYRVTFIVEIASNAPTNAVGVGGAPGESVILKAGATGFEPKDTLDNDNWYRLNVDKGNQSVAGDDVTILGHIGVADNTSTYSLITRVSPSELQVKTDSNGNLWLLVGTDSGFEGLTELYYATIGVLIEWP